MLSRGDGQYRPVRALLLELTVGAFVLDHTASVDQTNPAWARVLGPNMRVFERAITVGKYLLGFAALQPDTPAPYGQGRHKNNWIVHALLGIEIERGACCEKRAKRIQVCSQAWPQREFPPVCRRSMRLFEVSGVSGSKPVCVIRRDTNRNPASFRQLLSGERRWNKSQWLTWA